VQRLQAHPNRSQLARALQEYRRIIKTRFILRYHTRPEERKAVRRQLNKHELMHALHDFLFYGNDGKLRLATLASTPFRRLLSSGWWSPRCARRGDAPAPVRS
jgi:TnpA family transposase